MKNIFKRIDDFYNNNKWFRIAFTVFEYVIMFVIAFLSLIGLMVLAKKPVIYSNEYDLSNNIKQVYQDSNIDIPQEIYDQIYDEIYDEIYYAGYDDGEDKGWEDGYRDGLVDGFVDGYDEGSSHGFNDGFVDGFNDGMDEVFNINNLMPIAEVRERGTYGPANEFFAFTIPINKKVNSITLLNLFDYQLKPIDWLSPSGNMRQGFNVVYEDSSQKFYSFFDAQINDFSNWIYIEVDENKTVETITLALALNNVSMPNTDYDNMIIHMDNNLGVYINNKILNDNALENFKRIFEFEFINSIEYQQILEIEFDKGYDKGLTDNPNNHWSDLLFTIFGAFGTILGIEILPGWSIGIIIGIPIVFGIIYFIIGRKKD